MILYVNCILSSSYYYIITCTTVPPYRLSVVSIDEDEIDAAAWHDLEEVAAWTTHPINRECLIFQFVQYRIPICTVQNSYSSATVR